MKKVSITIEVPDNFSFGDCYDCPLHYNEESFDEDDGYDTWPQCVLDKKPYDCPIIVS